MARLYEIDNIDMLILNLLMEDASIPYTAIAKEVGVSAGTVHVRMAKLEKIGVVRGSTINVDPSLLGYDICAFMGVYLQKGSLFREVLQGFREIKEVVELHYTTGTYSMFVKVICRDTQHLRTVLNEKIQVIEGVERTETFISLEESIKRPISMTNI